MVRSVQLDQLQIFEGDGSPVDMWAYHRCLLKRFCVYLGYLLTCGFLRLIFHWFPHWLLICTYKSCGICEAEKILVKDTSGVYYVHEVKVQKFEPLSAGKSNYEAVYKANKFSRSELEKIKNDENVITYFIHKRLKYIWNKNSELFELLKGFEECAYDSFVNPQPLDGDTVLHRRVLYGANSIDIRLTPVIKILLNECLNPFYCFQMFSCILWYIEEYWTYATCILVISAFSLMWQVFEIRRNERALQQTVCNSSVVSVCRTASSTSVNNEEFHEIDSTELVPGDLIEIPCNGCLMQCDAVLLTGSCIVNESTLTGESVPVTKTALPNQQSTTETFNVQACAKHMLFCGTSVIQTRNYANERVLAIVVRIGFRTAKGELVRTILFPKPMKFKFIQDALRFVVALACLAVVGLGLSIFLLVRRGVDTFSLVVRALDLVTVVVPPALPVAMTVGIVFAQRRLRSQGIFCINPNVINVCGVINVACFDKTGTLTEDGLDLWGVIPNKDGVFDEPVLDPTELSDGPLLECMATCHTLTLIEGVLSGDPLDLKMFQSIKWEFIEEASEDHCKFEMAVPAIVRPNNQNSVPNITTNINLQPDRIPYEVGILKQFPFSSSLQRMSVIARVLNSTHFSVYSKGAPETIESLCRRDTIPSNFHSSLLEYTREGYRVLALAWRPLKAAYTKVLRAPRERIEQDLLFLGLLIMENRLKPETTPVMITLKRANIRPVMVTGDNMLTALSVARDCEMIDEFDRIIIVSAKPPPKDETRDLVIIPAEGDVRDGVDPFHLPQVVTHDRGYVTHSNCLSSSLTSQTQNDHLVQFHYAEDLHKPVTEVTATTRSTFNGCSNAQHSIKSINKNDQRLFASRLRFLREYRTQSKITTIASSSSAHPNANLVQAKSHSIDLSSNSHIHPLSDNFFTHESRSVTIQMIDRPDFHLAMSGKTWGIIRDHYPWLIPKLVVKGTIFARFSPEQKAQLVEALQSVGYFVSMCGDGANDCGALKCAHAGIALSEAEASVASPFTSKLQNISCVPTLIREGRCALVTSFGTFKFMVGYSMVQFFSVILLYFIGSNITDGQFIYYDLFLITSLGLTLGYTRAYPKLSPEPPGVRLLSTVTLLSLGLQLLTCAFMQIGAFVLVQFQPWYLPLHLISPDYELTNYENTSIFIISVYQYIIFAIVFSKGAPYRRSLFSNYLFVLNLLICTLCSVYLTSYPVLELVKYFELIRLPSLRFVLILHGAVLANFLLSYILESFVDGVSFRRRIRHIRQTLFPRHVVRKDYERIREEIDRLAGSWPPIIRSASVQALPKDLFNDRDANTPSITSRPSRRRHLSSLSTDSDTSELPCTAVNYTTTTQSVAQYPVSLPRAVQPTVGCPLDGKQVQKENTNLSYSHRRNSLYDVNVGCNQSTWTVVSTSSIGNNQQAGQIRMNKERNRDPPRLLQKLRTKIRESK